MRAILLPIKDLKNAKKRLAALLSPQERASLAEAMLADMFRVLRGVRRAERIFVVTNSAVGIQAAKDFGWEVIEESRQESESASVDAASRLCAERGVTSLLRLPLDLPLARSCDVDDLLRIVCSAPAAVVVPSRDGTGTNAILRAPPQLFSSHFGPGSFRRHCDEARNVGARFIVRRNARVEMDVDDPSDLLELLHHDLEGTETGHWLREHSVADRFRRGVARTAF